MGSRRLLARRCIAAASGLVDPPYIAPAFTMGRRTGKTRRAFEVIKQLVDGTISIGGVEVARFDEVEFT